MELSKPILFAHEINPFAKHQIEIGTNAHPRAWENGPEPNEPNILAERSSPGSYESNYQS